MQEVYDRIDAYVEQYGQDERIDVWAVRALGMIGTFIAHNDNLTDEQIREGFERLFALAPDKLLAATGVVALDMSANPTLYREDS